MASAVVPATRDILNALAEPTTCTHDILPRIRSLLGIKEEAADWTTSKENVKAVKGHARSKTAITNVRVKVEPRGRAKPHTREPTAVEITISNVLKPRDRVIFAFQVVNACVQTLSKLAKDHVAAKRAALESGAIADQKDTAKRNSPPNKTLRPKSPNAIRSVNIDEICSTRQGQSYLANVANCSCAALDFLRVYYCVGDAKDSGYQVENGMLSVIAKCIDLELFLLARHQLCHLKSRLLEQIGSTAEKGHFSIADLISFPEEVKSSTMLGLAVKLQHHALQLAASQQYRNMIDGLASHLVAGSEQSSDLVSHFVHYAKQKEHHPKSLRQITILPRLLLELAAVKNISAGSILILRCTAYNAQIQVAKLTDAWRNETPKELGLRVARSLESFGRSFSSFVREQYDQAKAATSAVVDSLGAAPGAEAGIAIISRSLNQLAIQADLVTSQGDAIPVIDLVRMASKELTSKEHSKFFTRAVVALSTKELPSEPSEADRLLMEVIGFRKVIQTYSGENLDSHADLLRAAVACVTFLRRYASGEGQPRDQRLRMARKVARFLVNTVVICFSRCSPDEANLLESIGGCCDLFVDLATTEPEFAKQRFGDPDNPSSSVFLTLSRLSFKLYVQHTDSRRQTDGPGLAALQLSLRCIDPWSSEEKSQGDYTTKLQYLLDILIGKELWTDAHLSWTKLFDALVESKAMRQMIELVESMPIRKIFGKEAPGYPISRAIQSMVEIQLNSTLDDATMPSFNHDLQPETRGVLLECQLDQLTQYCPRTASARAKCDLLIQSISHTLDQIYSHDQFPIRRLRVAVIITQHASINTSLDGVSENQKLDMENLGQDVQLQSWAKCLEMTLLTAQIVVDMNVTHQHNQVNDILEGWASLARAVAGPRRVNDIISDTDCWTVQMIALADYFAARFEPRLEARVLLIMAFVLNLAQDRAKVHVEVLSRLALTFVRLGHTGKARVTLSHAKSILASAKLSTGSWLAWYSAEAEYLVSVGEFSECRGVLREAATIATNGAEVSFAQATLSSSSSSLRACDKRLIARFAFTSARLELESGHPALALRLANVAKSMMFKIWASIERTQGLSGLDASVPTSAGDTVHPLVTTRTYSKLADPRLRSLVQDLVEVAMVEKSAHEYRGDYHEGFAVLKHVKKVADNVSRGSSDVCNLAVADLYVRSLPLGNSSVTENKLDSAQDYLDQIDQKDLMARKTLDTVLIGMGEAAILAARGEYAQRTKRLEGALASLNDLYLDNGLKELVPQHHQVVNPTEQLTSKLAALQLKDPRSKRPITKSQGPIAKSRSKARSAKPKPVAESVVAITDDIVVECAGLDNWYGVLLREIVLAAVQQQRTAPTTSLAELLQKADDFQRQPLHAIGHGVASATLLRNNAIQQMASDITFNALQDSITSIPASQTCLPSTTKAPTAPRKRGRPTKKPQESEVAVEIVRAEPAFATKLLSACDMLQKTFSNSLTHSSVASFRQHSRSMAELALTISALCRASTSAYIHPLLNAYELELPNIRARMVNHAAQHPCVDKIVANDLKAWPTLVESHEQPEYALLDPLAFKTEYLDTIPRAWNIVSMSLTNDRSAIVLARYRHGQTPFILRIPFAHHESEDAEEEFLNAASVFERLRRIIKQHEFSPAEAGLADAAAYRKQWWTKKHQLDEELRHLLETVEDQWFASVKGIFSPQIYDPQALSNFQAQLLTILIQHCPLQKAKGKAKAPNAFSLLKFESKILELFVGLGDPHSEVEVEDDDGTAMESLAESTRMADGIHGLVRMVLESLQFSGETIAIDEIDMDVVVIKIIDALKEYYASTSDDTSLCQHTVLVLDNQLHGFPWESLPCLRYQSVSRLPSLADLRQRVLAAKLVGSDAEQQAHFISRLSGTSLVNPSGDLKRTAERFEPWLPTLPPNWAHLKTAPEDDSWQKMLSENELFLYVGHGSTAQYVRPRVVRKLGYTEAASNGQTCAVSWLVGCSSLAMEDLGDFEPSGMVLSYLAAGSPAVLGALWDVGDIDADTFSINAAEYWGLWGESNKGLDAKQTAMRNRIAAVKQGLGGRKLEMCEAVARSRRDCKLPYLNGAAFVVYGIPVILKDG